MATQQWPARKRERDEDDDDSTTSFGEHRTKRRIATLPHRASPRLFRHSSPPVGSWNSNYTAQPAPPTITPADSDSEEAAAAAAEPRSVFSPFSSSPAPTVVQGSPSPFYDGPDTRASSQSTQMSSTFSEDFEMTDSIHLSPGTFHNDSSSSLSGRIPTPIHSSFSSFVRADKSSLNREPDFADDEAMVDRFRRGRRLPSPISEGESSPGLIVAGFEDMQMEVDQSASQELEKQTPTKKGHTRSKHSLRPWTGLGGETGTATNGMKRSFSMGYRADCEKCRMKVPGHFSHIITY